VAVVTTRDAPWPEGTPCWVEVRVDDPARTAAFYRELFGWAWTDRGPAYEHYLTASLDGREVADIGPRRPDEASGGPPAWLVCFAVRGTDTVAARIGAAGGRILVPPADVGTHGRFTVAADPAGAVFGLWQAGRYFGARVADVAGSAVWHQCLTTDVEAAVAFYEAVFGLTATAPAGAPPGPRDAAAPATHSGARCVALGLDGSPVAGVGPLGADGGPADLAPHWRVTFGAADVDAAVALVRAGGGSVLSGPLETPHGRAALVTDPGGVAFGLLAVPVPD
jgi:predicted enzyme related to lactoylglutathione lyase